MTEKVDPRLLRIEQFAEQLNIKPSTARAWLLRRRVCKVRVGRRAIRIPASEIQRIISEGMVPAREDRRGR
jgi:excisionase family DNA binding protein